MRALAAFFVVAILSLAPCARAQTNETEFEPLRFGFAAYVGSGIYASGSQVVWLLRIPVTIPVLPHEDRPFGVRIRIRGTFGFFNFHPSDLLQVTLPDNVGTVSLLAGVDFPVQIRKNWLVAPFLDAGPAWDSETKSTSAVVGLGIWSRAEFPLKSGRYFVLWNELVRAADYADDPAGEASFAKLLGEAEFRIPLNWAPAGRPTTVAPYGKVTWLFDPLEVGGLIDDVKKIRQRYELGFKIGTENKEKLWKVPLPRLGLGYRFGQEISSVRFIFSWQY